MPTKQADPDLERLWRDRLQRWRASGLPARAFCAAQRLPESSFSFWRAELQRREAARANAPPFVAVHVTAPPPPLERSASRRAATPPCCAPSWPYWGSGRANLAVRHPGVRLYEPHRHAPRLRFGGDPLSGHLFLFRSRGDRVKILDLGIHPYAGYDFTADDTRRDHSVFCTGTRDPCRPMPCSSTTPCSSGPIKWTAGRTRGASSTRRE